MLRIIWLPTAWLLRLLLLLALPPLLFRQQPTLTATRSLLYVAYVPCSSFLLWLRKSYTRHQAVVPAAAAVAATTLSIFILHASASAAAATEAVHLDKAPMLRTVYFYSPPQQQSYFVRSPKSQQPGSSIYSHASAPLTAATPTRPPRACLDCLDVHLAASSCCSWFLALSSCMFTPLRTRVRKGRKSSSQRSSCTSDLHRPYNVSRACRDSSCTHPAVISSPVFALFSLPVSAFTGAHNREQQLPAVFHNRIACPLQVITPTFTRCHDRGKRKPHMCYGCVRLDSQRTLPPITFPRRVCLQNTSFPAIRFADAHSASHKTWRREGTSTNSRCCRVLSFPASFLLRQDARTCFAAPGGAAAVSLFRGTAAFKHAPSAEAPVSSCVTTSTGGTRTNEAAKLSAAPCTGTALLLAGTRTALFFASSGEGCLVASWSKRGRVGAKPSTTLEGASSIQPTASEDATVSTLSLRPRTATPFFLAAGPALQVAVLQEETGTLLRKQTRVFSSIPPLPPSPSETGSYPFKSIEEKWVRYYAEHPEDYSPPLPGSKEQQTSGEHTYKAKSSSFDSAVHDIALHTYATASSRLRVTELDSRISEAKPSCNKQRASSGRIESREEVLEDSANDVDVRATSHTLHSLNPLSLDHKYKRAVTAVAVKNDRIHKGPSEDNKLLIPVKDERSTKETVVVDTAETDVTSLTPALDLQSSATDGAVLLPRGLHRQLSTSTVVQNRKQEEELCSHTAGAGHDPSVQRCGDDAETDGRELHQGLEQATKGNMRSPETGATQQQQQQQQKTQTQEETSLDGKEKQDAEARTAREKKKYHKFYILSMIPYPSGEGLHVGHSLTYTVADVVARYKRLQLRGELLREHERSSKERTAVHRSSAEEEKRRNTGKQQQQQEQSQRYQHHTGQTVGRHLQRDSHQQAVFRQESKKDEESICSLSTQDVVASWATTDKRNGQAHFEFIPGFAETGATATSQQSRGRATLNQAEREKQQDLPPAIQQPDVMHVMGWDTFGLPAEQHAIVSGIPPRVSVCKNVQRFRRQLQRLGLSVDWRREINTSDPEYFRWTQWMFLQMWKRGLVYEKAANVNWCEALGTVLADEEVVNGVSNRGHHPVKQRCLEQWHLRITTYAEELLKSLDSLDWPEDVKAMQRNWIGKRDLLYLNLPLLSSSVVANENTVFAGENEDSKRQAAAKHACGREGISSELLQGACLSADGVPTKVCAAEHAGSIKKENNKKSITLRCVSISPEFLFGATFVAMHAAHKQADVVALSPAAREWLRSSQKNCQLTVEQEKHHPTSAALRVETEDLRTIQQQKSPDMSSEGRVAADLAEPEMLLTGLQSETTVEDKKDEQSAVVTDTKGMRRIHNLSSFFGKESVFSGTYVKHPLTETRLPIWLFSGIFFDQLRGAKTYFSQQDAVLVVPGGKDSFAEWFAHAAGLHIIKVLASRTGNAGVASHRKTTPTTASRSKTLRLHHKKDDVPEKTTECGLQDDVVINSQCEKINVNGLSREQARQRILDHLVVAGGIGEHQPGFALRDWVFSRQRFWGEPIPLIRAHALKDGWSSVLAETETNLPVTLPEKMICGRRGGLHKHCRSEVHTVAQRVVPGSSSGEHTCNNKGLRPVGNVPNFTEGSNSAEDNSSNRYLYRSALMAPLAHYPHWWNITHRYDSSDILKKLRPIQRISKDSAGSDTKREANSREEIKTKVELQREVSTMPQWAGSSWYFLRFLDPHNRHKAFNKEDAQYWMPVDLYVGGKEHAVTHLLYARLLHLHIAFRFWHKVLRDIGCVACGEPFRRLCAPGIILGTPQYVGFQRLDTGEWVSASDVSLKKKENLPAAKVSQRQLNSSSSTKQGIMPKVTFSTSTRETALTSTRQRSQDDALSKAKSGFQTNRHIATASIADTFSQQDVVCGVHNPSGQPVREVSVEKAAILHVKESDVPVLKENENIEAVCRHEKMSKSRGNVVSPDSLIDAYGADALRLHLLFMGPIEARKVWSVGGIKGISRFLSRVWHLTTPGRKIDVQHIGDDATHPPENSTSSLRDLTVDVGRGHSVHTEIPGEADKDAFARRTRKQAAPLPTTTGESVTVDCPKAEHATRHPLKSEGCFRLHNSRLSSFENTLLKQLIERVTRQVERLAFNTALAALMCAVRKLSQWKAEGNALSVHTALILVRLLHPFAPFITEEIWFKIHERFPNVSRYGSSPSLLACGTWPTNEDSEINTCDTANDESSTTRKQHTCAGIARGTEPTVDVGVYIDGKFHLKVHAPVGYVNDNVALQEYVKRDVRVSQILEKKKVLRSIVVPKATHVNFVTKHVNTSGDELN